MGDDAVSLAAETIAELGIDLDEMPELRDKVVPLAAETALEHVGRQVQDRLGRKDRKHLVKLVAKGNWPEIEALLARTLPGFYVRAAFRTGIVDSILMLKAEQAARTRWGRIATFDAPCPLVGCALSADGTMVAAVGTNGDVTVWNTAIGEVRASLHGHADAAISCAFSPDGTLVASTSKDRTCKVWEIATEFSTTLVGHEETVRDCIFSPDGSLVATAGDDGVARLWDAATGKETAALRGHKQDVLSCAFSPDGRLLLTGGGGADSTLKLWDLSSGAEIRTFTGHEIGVTRCRFSPDGSSAVSSSGDETVRIWDVQTGEARATMEGHKAAVLACAFSWDGSLVISTDIKGIIRFWRTDERRGTKLAEMATLAEKMAALDGGYRMWIPGHLGAVMCCAVGPSTPAVSELTHWSTESGVLATAGADRTVRLWGPAGVMTWS